MGSSTGRCLYQVVLAQHLACVLRLNEGYVCMYVCGSNAGTPDPCAACRLCARSIVCGNSMAPGCLQQKLDFPPEIAL